MKKLFGFLKKLILTIIVVLLLLIIGIFVYFRFFFDLNQYKPLIAKIVEEQIGRKLEIKGNASLGISLIPTLEIENVSLANASWAGNKNMVQIERVDIQVSILPLLKKEIEIYRVILNKPEVYLEINKSGKANWDFSQQQARLMLYNQYAQNSTTVATDAQVENETQGFAITSVFAKNLLIENGLVKFSNLKENSDMTIKINELSVSSQSAVDDIKIGFDIVFNGNDIIGKATVGSIKSLLESLEPYPVDLTVKAFNVSAAVQGSVLNVMNENIHYNLNLQVANPKGNFIDQAVSLAGNLDGNLKKLKLQIQKLDVNSNVITGSVTADISGKVPYANVNLASDLIDLETLMPQQQTASLSLPSLVSTAHASNLVPDMPIPYEFLSMANANLALAVKTLIINQDMTTRDVQLEAKLDKSVLDVYMIKTKFGDGLISADAKIDGIKQTIGANVYSKNLVLQNVYKPLNDTSGQSFAILSGGKAEVKLSIDTFGATSKALVNHLNGQFITIVDKSEVNLGELKLLSGTVISQVFDLLKLNKKKNVKAELQCAVVRADIKDGKFSFPNGIAFDSNQFMLSADGSVNLQNDKIDFTVKPFSDLTDVANLSKAFSSFIKIGGTLEKPSVGINETQAAKAIIGMAVGAPVYAASVALDANSEPCYYALENTAYSKYFPAPTGVAATTKNTYAGAEKLVKETVKSAGKAVESTLNSAKDAIKNITTSSKTSEGTEAKSDAANEKTDLKNNVKDLMNKFGI